MQWIENGPIPIAPELVGPVLDDRRCPETVNQEAVGSAIARWQSTHRGQGHVAFFQLAVDLRGAGMGYADIQMTLKAQAQFARSKRDREADIPRIMEALKRKSRIPLKD